MDMLDAARKVTAITTGKSLADYGADWGLRSIVERQLQILGEALRKAAQIRPGVLEQISQSREIIAFRDRLVHGYDSLSDLAVWNIVENHLPHLTKQIAALLEDRSGG